MQRPGSCMLSWPQQKATVAAIPACQEEMGCAVVRRWPAVDVYCRCGTPGNGLRHHSLLSLQPLQPTHTHEPRVSLWEQVQPPACSQCSAEGQRNRLPSARQVACGGGTRWGVSETASDAESPGRWLGDSPLRLMTLVLCVNGYYSGLAGEIWSRLGLLALREPHCRNYCIKVLI